MKIFAKVGDRWADDRKLSFVVMKLGTWNAGSSFPGLSRRLHTVQRLVPQAFPEPHVTFPQLPHEVPWSLLPSMDEATMDPAFFISLSQYHPELIPSGYSPSLQRNSSVLGNRYVGVTLTMDMAPASSPDPFLNLLLFLLLFRK